MTTTQTPVDALMRQQFEAWMDSDAPPYWRTTAHAREAWQIWQASARALAAIPAPASKAEQAEAPIDPYLEGIMDRATQPTASAAGEREATELLRELVLAQNDYNDAIGAWGSGRPAAKEELRLLKARGAAHIFITTRAALASKPPAGEQKPVMTYLGRHIMDCGEHGSHDMEMHVLIPAGTKLYTAPHPEPVAQAAREARHIATGTDLEWQAKIFHEEMDKLGVPRDDGEDFYSLIGRANLALSATPPAQAVQDSGKSLNALIADQLRPFLKPGEKVIWREAFRWHDDDGVLSNHYDSMSVSNLADDFGYEFDWELNMNHAAIIRAARTRGNGVEPS